MPLAECSPCDPLPQEGAPTRALPPNPGRQKCHTVPLPEPLPHCTGLRPVLQGEGLEDQDDCVPDVMEVGDGRVQLILAKGLVGKGAGRTLVGGRGFGKQGDGRKSVGGCGECMGGFGR